MNMTTPPLMVIGKLEALIESKNKTVRTWFFVLNIEKINILELLEFNKYENINTCTYCLIESYQENVFSEKVGKNNCRCYVSSCFVSI